METIKINEIIRQIREVNYEQTKHLSDEELIAYFHETAQRVHEQIGQSFKQLHRTDSEIYRYVK